MPYFGYIEVEVRDMRQTGNPEGANAGMIEYHKQIVKIEDQVADEIARLGVGDEATQATMRALAEVEGAIKSVRNLVVKDELADRWQAATRGMSREKMEAALAVLEVP